MKFPTLVTALLSTILILTSAQIIQTTPPAWSDVAPCAVRPPSPTPQYLLTKPQTQCFTENFPVSADSSQLEHPCATTTGFVRCLENYCPGDSPAYTTAVGVLSTICTYLHQCLYIPYKCQGYPNAGPGYVPSTTTSSSSSSRSTTPPSTTISVTTASSTSIGLGTTTSTITITYTSTIECCC